MQVAGRLPTNVTQAPPQVGYLYRANTRRAVILKVKSTTAQRVRNQTSFVAWSGENIFNHWTIEDNEFLILSRVHLLELSVMYDARPRRFMFFSSR